MKRVPLTRGLFAKVSDQDYAAVRKFKWYCSGKPGQLYAQTWTDGEPLHLHRLIADRKGLPRSLQVDHRNGKRLDCQRRNLRAATNQQNQMNRHAVLAKSGVKGVYPNTNGRWQARIMVNQHIINLGTFDTIAQAAKARRHGEKKYFGAFA